LLGLLIMLGMGMVVWVGVGVGGSKEGRGDGMGIYNVGWGEGEEEGGNGEWGRGWGWCILMGVRTRGMRRCGRGWIMDAGGRLFAGWALRMVILAPVLGTVTEQGSAV
jgi:hypothetical protein